MQERDPIDALSTGILHFSYDAEAAIVWFEYHCSSHVIIMCFIGMRIGTYRRIVFAHAYCSTSSRALRFKDYDRDLPWSARRTVVNVPDTECASWVMDPKFTSGVR